MTAQDHTQDFAQDEHAEIREAVERTVDYVTGNPWLGVLAAGGVGLLLGALHAVICNLPRVNFVARADDGRPFYDRMTDREVDSTDAIGRPLRWLNAKLGSARIELSASTKAELEDAVGKALAFGFTQGEGIIRAKGWDHVDTKNAVLATGLLEGVCCFAEEPCGITRVGRLSGTRRVHLRSSSLAMSALRRRHIPAGDRAAA